MMIQQPDIWPLAVLFHRLGPYHHARLRAAGRYGEVVAVEFSVVDDTYAWEMIRGSDSFRKLTLFRDADIDTKTPDQIQTAIFKALDDIKPRVIAVPGWSHCGSLAALLWAWNNGVPVVVMSDSSSMYRSRGWLTEAVKQKIVKLNSAGLVAGTPQRDYLEQLGIPCNRIFIGYDVVDNDHFSAGAAAVRKIRSEVARRYSLPDHFFLNNSRFIVEKNLPNLIAAYAKYRQIVGDTAWPLVLVGDGPLLSELTELVNRLGVAGYVKFCGFVQYDELPAYYELADTLVLASQSETWGLVVNEAMASGLPVLVSNRCGCAPDLVQDGVNGFTFDPYDVDALAGLMIKMASDEVDRVAMGAASREIISHWTPQTFADNLLLAAAAALDAPPRRIGIMDKLLLKGLIRR